MRIFVTGGAGFIGSNFIRHVLDVADDVRITNYDALTYAGNLASLADVADDDRYTFVKGDICDPATVRDVMAGHDAVVNFAAESHVDRSIDGPGRVPAHQRHRCRGGLRGRPAARASTGSCTSPPTRCTARSPNPTPSSRATGCSRTRPTRRPRPGADLLARSYGVTYDHPILVTRTANNFGPYHYPEKVIPLFVTNLIDDRSVPLYGDGQNVRDWTYVVDNAAAQWLVLTEGTPGEVYNVGAGNEMTNKELTYAILERMGRGEEMIEFVADRPGHDLRYSVDTSKVRELGWSPAHTFEEALDATIDWYRSHEDWWRPLKDAGASHRGAGSEP